MKNKKDSYVCNSSVATYDYIKKKIKIEKLEVERFGIILLNNKLDVLDFDIISLGGMTSTILDLKVIFKKALNTFRCTGFITFHNHPSNNANPSENDDNLYEKIKAAAETMDFKYVDNLIVCDDMYYSYEDN
jgi:DNA repair protein RadC